MEKAWDWGSLTWSRRQKLSLSGLVRDEEANPNRALLAVEGDGYVSVKE